MAVIEAILAGERDPERLLKLCEVQIQKKKAERIKEALRGTWAEEHLFALRQALESWRHYQQQIAACDQQIEAVFKSIDAGSPPPDSGSPAASSAPRKKPSTNAPQIDDLHEMLIQLCGGKDLTVLPAHTDYTVLRILSETGTDLTQWQSEKHFTAWSGLAPGSAGPGGAALPPHPPKNSRASAAPPAKPNLSGTNENMPGLPC